MMSRQARETLKWLLEEYMEDLMNSPIEFPTLTEATNLTYAINNSIIKQMTQEGITPDPQA